MVSTPPQKGQSLKQIALEEPTVTKELGQVQRLRSVARLNSRYSFRPRRSAATLRPNPLTKAIGNEPASLQPLGVKRYANAIMPENPDQRAAAATEHVEIAGVRVALAFIVMPRRFVEMQKGPIGPLRQAEQARRLCSCSRKPRFVYRLSRLAREHPGPALGPTLELGLQQGDMLDLLGGELLV